jgi:ATP-dependent RNA helicase RhlE
MPFRQLSLIEPLLRAIHSEGYTIPTAIQKQAIPYVLAGKDLLGCAQTGTGKTAAFALPILQRLLANPLPAKPGAKGPDSHGRPIRALILTPTRELAAQIGESFRVYGQHTGLRQTVIFGGVGQRPQEQALRKGIDILVATPGRLLDLMNQRLLSLGRVEIFVLDEADRMLDMGFIHDIRRVIAVLPTHRQTLMFSATMPREIRSLADMILQKPVEVKIATESPAADTVGQTLYHVESGVKPVLLEHLLQDPAITRALVFTRTKHGADKVVKRLCRAQIAAEAIHSNKSQNARTRALDNFKKGATRVLVASDIAARGLDVDNISHVINYDLPHESETYVHRIGRTGRAGLQGLAISFCSGDQRDLLRDIERLLGRKIPVVHAPKLAVPEPTLESSRESGQAHSHYAQRHASHQGSRQPSHQSAQDSSSGETTARPLRKGASPEQQKNNFWTRRRKPGSSFQGRRRRPGR